MEAPRRPPLLDERGLGRVHGPLALDQARGEAFEHLHEQLLHRAEVVVHEAVVDPGLLGQATGADASVALAHEEALGGVQQGLDDLLAIA